MNKATLIVLITSQFLYYVSSDTSEYQNWTNVEKAFGVKECWEILRKHLNESCMEKGANGVVSVNFTECKMRCTKNPQEGFVDATMPDGTPCGLYNETCQGGTCKGECFIPTETIEGIVTK
uniref:Putative ixostatin n=1 Tax=Ixodes ricinus TaxID=34613 RepID=A0A0K8RDG6_IXORI